MNNTICLSIGLSPAIQKTLLFSSFKKGDVNRSESYLTDPSGKCINVCRVLSQSGINVECLTVVGKENRREFEGLCDRDLLDVTMVETTGRIRTCTTLVETESNICSEIVVNEPELVTPEEEGIFKSVFLKKLSGQLKCVIISGSRLKGFSEDLIPFMVRKIKERKILLFADYKGIDLRNSLVSEDLSSDYIKINEGEFFDTFSHYFDLREGLIDISLKYDSVFIISRGSRSVLVAENGKIMEIPCKIIKAINPIGSGDAMTAGLAQGIIGGLSLKEAVEKGRDYGALNAMNIHPGSIQ